MTWASRMIWTALLALAGSLVGGPVPVARADDAAPPVATAVSVAPDGDPWRIGYTAYGWATNISGSVGARGQRVAVDASFLDLVQKSSSIGAFMSYLEADKGRVGLYVDFMWTKLGFGRSVVAYRNPLPGLALTLNGNAALTTELTMLEAGGLYELQRWAAAGGSFTAVDALLGFRYWNSTASASFDGLGTATFAPLGIGASRSIGVSISSTMQWVEPVVGLRVRHEFSPTQSIMVRGDLAGFGLNDQLGWQALGVYTYKWKMNGYDIAAVAGYRAIGTRYSAGSGFDASSLDLVLHGPVIGAGIRF
jgi:hypothetical protein